MAGENALISIKNYGERRVVVTRVVHGMSVFAHNQEPEAESRTRKAFLTYKRSSGSFDMTTVFTSSQRREVFCDWLRGYMVRISNPNAMTVPVRVIVPSREFDKTAMLEGDLVYGDRVGDIIYPLELSFMGASSPINRFDDSLRSKFSLPVSEDPALTYLYPAGSQLRAGQSPDDPVSPFDENPDLRGLLR